MTMMGEPELSFALDNLGNLGQDGSFKTELWPEITAIIVANEESIFDKEGAVEGYGKWAPLSGSDNIAKIKEYKSMIRKAKNTGGLLNESWYRSEIKRLSGGGGYAAWKAKHYPGMPILQLTGRLITAATVPGAPDNINSYEPFSMEYGVSDNIPYAYKHQYGSKDGRTPARRYMHLTASSTKKIYKTIHQFIFKKIGRIIGKGKGNKYRERSIAESMTQAMNPEYQSMRQGTSGTVGQP